MKIFFVHLGREHLGIEYLSAVLRQAGHDTQLGVDIGIFGRNDNIVYNPFLEKRFSQTRAIIRKAREYEPDIISMTAYSSTLQWCFDMASRLKSVTNAHIIIGGTHITLCPESALLSQHIDYGVRGEAETVICDIVSAIGSGQDPSEIPGVISRNLCGIRVNPPAPIVSDIDALPLPDKELFARAFSISEDYVALTTRGCCFHCTYCCEHFHTELYRGQPYRRMRSVDSLIEELNVMKERYHFKKVHFACSQFPPDKGWVAEFSEKYASRIATPFWCFGHFHFFDHEYAKLLYDAGCRNVNFGLQTINENIRKNLLRRDETNENVAQVLKICDSVGLGYDIDIMFHLPGSKEEDYRETARFFSAFKNIHRIKLYNIVLFPGTELTDYALERGLIDQHNLKQLQIGVMGDYFHIPMSAGVDAGMTISKTRAYRNVLRLLPIAPHGTILLLLGNLPLKILGRIPESLIKIIEMFRLLLKKDARLGFYLKMYRNHIFRSLTGRHRF